MIEGRWDFYYCLNPWYWRLWLSTSEDGWALRLVFLAVVFTRG